MGFSAMMNVIKKIIVTGNFVLSKGCQESSKDT
jgi:hypothetical protein